MAGWRLECTPKVSSLRLIQIPFKLSSTRPQEPAVDVIRNLRPLAKTGNFAYLVRMQSLKVFVYDFIQCGIRIVLGRCFPDSCLGFGSDGQEVSDFGFAPLCRGVGLLHERSGLIASAGLYSN